MVWVIDEIFFYLIYDDLKCNCLEAKTQEKFRIELYVEWHYWTQLDPTYHLIMLSLFV